MVTDTYLRVRDGCTAASLDEIMRRHDVSREEIAAVTGARELWIDLLAVVLPMTALFLVVGRRVADGCPRQAAPSVGGPTPSRCRG